MLFKTLKMQKLLVSVSLLTLLGCVGAKIETKPKNAVPAQPMARSWSLESFLAEPYSCGEKPLVFAHRGASGYKPEHTLESYKLAIEQGADYIEPDVVITKDRVLVVRHENELSTTTNVAEKYPKRKTKKLIDGEWVEGWFSEDFTLAEIKNLRAKERLAYRSQKENGRYEVPTLEEVFTFVRIEEKKRGRTIGLVPELKHSNYFRKIQKPLEEGLLRLLKTYNYNKATDPIFIQSFEVSNLKWLRGMTNVRLVQLIDDPSKVPADIKSASLAGQKSYLQMLQPEGLKDIAQYADVVSPHKSVLVRTDGGLSIEMGQMFMEAAKAAGLKVVVWTFRSDKENLPEVYNGQYLNEYLLFYRLGVEGIFSDFPDHAIKARENHLAQCKK